MFGIDDAAAAALIGTAVNAGVQGASAVAQGKLNRKTRNFNREEAEKQRVWSEMMQDKTNAWNYQMWQETNAYNSPAEQRQRLIDAGLNPIYFGLDGSSAGQISAAQPLGYERAEIGNMPNPLDSLAGLGDVYMNAKSLQKEIELKNAEIDKIKEDTQGMKLDNEWKDKTMEARTQAETLKNQLSKSQVNQIDSQIKKNEQDIKESIARTKNEDDKNGLILAQTMLAQANAYEVIALLPYRQLLTQAQTAAQKASASASYVHAAYEQGLIDAGYIDKMCGELESSIKQHNAQADNQDIQNAVNEWKLSVKNGNAFDFESIPWTRPGDKIAAYLGNSVFSIVAKASEAVGGGLSGFFK